MHLQPTIPEDEMIVLESGIRILATNMRELVAIKTEAVFVDLLSFF